MTGTLQRQVVGRRGVWLPSCLFGWVGASVGSKGRVGEAGSIQMLLLGLQARKTQARREEATQKEAKYI